MKRDYGILLLVFFLWGSLYVVSKYAFETIPPFTVLMIRNCIAVIPLYFLARKAGMKQIGRGDLQRFVLLGITGYFFGIGLQLLATSLLNASLASLINSVNPIFTSVFAVILLKEKITANKVVGIILSVIGVAIVLGVSEEGVNPFGVALSVGSVILWSMTSVGIRKMSREYPSQQITFMAILCAIPFSVAGSAVELQSKPIGFSISSMMAVLYMGIFCTAAANYLWAKALQRIDASVCTLFYPLQPLFSAILGIVLLHETITRNFVAGGILISLGVLIGVWKKKEPKTSGE